jgi:hypothetical protein
MADQKVDPTIPKHLTMAFPGLYAFGMTVFQGTPAMVLGFWAENKPEEQPLIQILVEPENVPAIIDELGKALAVIHTKYPTAPLPTENEKEGTK